MTTSVAEAFGCIGSGDLARLRSLLAANPGLAGARDDTGVSLCLQACYQRRGEMVETILAAGPELDIFDVSALPGQAERGKALLDANPALAGAYSADGFTALHLAAFFGQTEMARRLLAHRADPDAVSRNPMGLRPLHSAAASASFEIVQLLVDHGADVSARQHGGWTPLHAAADRGHVAMVEFLLSHSADPSQASDDGKTALDLAVRKGHDAVAGRLRG
jgi:ankyrin repeat protein